MAYVKLIIKNKILHKQFHVDLIVYVPKLIPRLNLVPKCRKKTGKVGGHKAKQEYSFLSERMIFIPHFPVFLTNGDKRKESFQHKESQKFTKMLFLETFCGL